MQKNVLEYLEASARRCPDKTAFTDGARSFTYAQLLSCAKGLGTHLARTAPCLRRPVAVLIGRTAESIAAMQGVLYAGGCYVPIDDHMPEARMRRCAPPPSSLPRPTAPRPSWLPTARR